MMKIETYRDLDKDFDLRMAGPCLEGGPGLVSTSPARRRRSRGRSRRTLLPGRRRRGRTLLPGRGSRRGRTKPPDSFIITGRSHRMVSLYYSPLALVEN